MTHIRAAFTFSGRISAQRVKDSAYAVSSVAGVAVSQVHAGVADGWVILAATLDAATAEQAHGWLLFTLTELERDDYAELFRVEINGEPRRLEA